MTELEIHEYRNYERSAPDWKDNDVATRQVWQLLGRLEDENILIQIPDWLADQKVGSPMAQHPQSSSVESIVKPTTPFYSVMQRLFHRF